MHKTLAEDPVRPLDVASSRDASTPPVAIYAGCIQKNTCEPTTRKPALSRRAVRTSFFTHSGEIEARARNGFIVLSHSGNLEYVGVYTFATKSHYSDNYVVRSQLLRNRVHHYESNRYKKKKKKAHFHLSPKFCVCCLVAKHAQWPRVMPFW